ncbi:CHAD domain-containing protein [Rugamonas sp. CCM 8940]|uniref:CYTH and CHAD domain-containing protein n=1 Tax=Rugamonas sp. CCM 8940 TaxID=2765359 RepID=UPI0018F5340E|nr:CYTH and CHAD domain-containing protein [Rugamonas sp. CCM 8940]MBJ7311860.1 CHAD domain-containing protein [Rugamonas sp. CCM 8940]
MEIELKLLLDANDNERLRQHPLIAAHSDGQSSHQNLLARYFDTSDFALRRQQAGLRVRQVDGSWIQTMKAGGSVHGGLHQRNEWEGPVKRAWPELGKLKKMMGADTDWRALLDGDLAKRLETKFTVRVERDKWDVRLGDDAIELVLDHGSVEHQEHASPVNEIELELKSGSAQGLYAFALALLEDIPLRLSNISKAERGYALCSQSGTTVRKARPPALPAGASVLQGMQAVIDSCLQQIQDNEDGVIHSDNPESLHQMRVGVRRLRSALKLFDGAAPCPAGLVEEIGWLGGALGGARDWEVLAAGTLQRLADTPAALRHLLAIQQPVLRQARQARHDAAQALLSPRYTRLLLRLCSWLLELPAQAGQDGAALARPLKKFARDTIKRNHERLLARAKAIDGGDAANLHRLRIAGKKARYALEFFQTLYRAGGVRRQIGALSAMQDELGRHNDLSVAGRLLAQLQQEHSGSAESIAFVRGYLLAQQGHETDGLAKAWQAFKMLPPPRPAG